jgi:hypothetical protein
LLFASTDDGIQCELKELCFAALGKFSPTSLQSHGKKINRIPGAMRPEAQYAYELYRCMYSITGGKCVIHSEYSYTVEGRIDFFIKSRQWGIECLKDGDRMSNHENRFQGQGAYGSWGIVCDYIILNFCTKPPKKKRGMVFQPSSYGNNEAVVTKRALFPDNSKLFHIVFNEVHDGYVVLDSELQQIAQSQLLR